MTNYSQVENLIELRKVRICRWEADCLQILNGQVLVQIKLFFAFLQKYLFPNLFSFQPKRTHCFEIIVMSLRLGSLLTEMAAWSPTSAISVMGDGVNPIRPRTRAAAVVTRVDVACENVTTSKWPSAWAPPSDASSTWLPTATDASSDQWRGTSHSWEAPAKAP